MNKAFFIFLCWTVAGVATVCAQKPAEDTRQSLFATLSSKGRKTPDALTAEEMTQLLQLSQQLGRPVAVAPALRSYLAKHTEAPAELFELAAENAEALGDYRVAVGRYKQMLRVSAPGPVATRAATRIGRLLLDYLGQPEAAFQFMAENGDRFRAPGASDPFDGWFLDRCYEQRLPGAMAARLVQILTVPVPLEQERMSYYHLDRMLERLAAAGPDQADAIIPGNRLLSLIRGSPVRVARTRFLLENLAFRCRAAGKELAAAERDFEPVLTAAQAYLAAAPKADTLCEIYRSFAGGPESPSDAVWNMQLAQKQAFFVGKAFEMLPDRERAAVLAWDWWGMCRRCATPQQWADLGARHTELFKTSAARDTLPFVTDSTNPAVCKAQSLFLTGACSRDAAIINSLAAADDLAGAVKHLSEKESWYGGPENYSEGAVSQLLRTRNTWPQTQGAATTAAANQRALADHATLQMFKTPVAVFSPESVSSGLSWAWNAGGATPEDKSRFVEHLHQLDWVPYSGETRRKVFEKVRNEIRGWAEETRRLYEAARKNNNTNLLGSLAPRVALVGTVQAALKQVTETDIADPAKAPGPVCRDLAQVMLAVNQKDLQAFVSAGRSLYAAIRDYEVKKTPYGEALLSYLTVNRPDRFDTFDFQCEILADQARLCAAHGVRRGLSRTLRNLCDGRPGWFIHNENNLVVPVQFREQRIKLNAAFLTAVEDSLAQGRLDGQLFNLYRGLRRSEQRDLDLIGKLITQRVLQKHPGVRVNHDSATCSYMTLIRFDFPALSQIYPPERFFDDMFIEECRRPDGKVDLAYWNYGRDEQRKVANAAAEHLGAFSRPPLGYDDQPARYTANHYGELLGRAMGADEPQRNALLAKLEAAFGTERFDEVSAGRVSLPYMPVGSPEQRRSFFEKIKRYVERSEKSNAPFALPYLPQLVTLMQDNKKLAEEEKAVLLNCFKACWWLPCSGGDRSVEQYIGLVHDLLLGQGKHQELVGLAPLFWRIARETGNPQIQDQLTRYANALLGQGQHDLAAVYSSAGLEMMGARLREDSRNALKTVRSKAVALLGGRMTVERSDRRYPLFEAQSFFEAGKLDNAWEQYLAGKEVMLTEFRELDVEFSIWLVERNIELGDYESADALAQRLIQWVDTTPQGFDIEARARLLMAYASVSSARQEYPRARAQYERIAAAREFENTQGARLAEIRIADIDRITKHYETAIERLERLRRRSDPVLQAETNYQLALVKYEQEDYAASREFLSLVFAANMSHANARILEGKLNLKMKKLVEATDVRVGLATERNTIIPGRPLKIQIEDRNLAVVGRLANIEVRVWTASGDEEFLTLQPFGDSKTQFEGEMPTALAPFVKGDHVLQLLGRDKVNYAFSEKFKQAAGSTADAVMTIEAISDAELFISSGKILNREELEERELRRQILLRNKNVETNGEMLSAMRADDEIKPGNPMSVRVIDPDRSTTAGKDVINVRVVTSSGDSVDNVILEETDTHSGVFDGKVRTATAPATAFASDSEEGKEPDFAISGTNYPPWVALADNRRPKFFTVDLNNNVAPGRLSILSDVPGRLLKRFTVQTSMNGKDYTTVAAWPEALPDWDGSLRFRFVRYGKKTGSSVPRSLNEFKQYLDLNHLTDGNIMLCATGVVSGKIGYNLLGLADKLMVGHGTAYIAHLQGVFYQSERKLRTFRFLPKGNMNTLVYFLTLDGQAGKKPAEVSLPLDKGLHQFDLYLAAVRGACEPEFEVQCDIPDPPYIACCPEAMFLPANRPANLPRLMSQAGKIEADALNTAFAVSFASNTTARLIRLGLADFEGDAPAIRRLSLDAADGGRILPTQEDVLSLRRNPVLEIVPGDRISVIYEDPCSVSKDKRVLEAFMKATFYNADVKACFVDSVLDDQGVRRARYLSVRRFKAGDPISVLINDTDGDVSDGQDKLTFTAKGAQGKAVTLEALESANHSGLFIGKFFPVSGEPRRASEVRVETGDDIVLTYADQQNTDYGIPWLRTYRVEQIAPTEPEIRIYDYTSRLLDESETKPQAGKADALTGEAMPVVRALVASRPALGAADRWATNILGAPLIVELRYPTLARSPLSTAQIYVQTSSALLRSGKSPTNAFDVTVPGTLTYEVGPGDAGPVLPPPGYSDVLVRGSPYAQDALDDGRFTFVIPMKLGEGTETVDTAELSETLQASFSDKELSGPWRHLTYMDEEGKTLRMSRQVPWPVLFVRPTDTVTIAFRIPGGDGQPERWFLRRVALTGDAFFDVMDQRFQKKTHALYMGERVYLRIVDPLRDLTNDKDTVTVSLPLSGGTVTQSVSLTETFAHSGVFKGSLQTVYSGVNGATAPADAVPVTYGGTLNLCYQAEKGAEPLIRPVLIHKGANGKVQPFTKRFLNPDAAVQTQFTIAESYFELAKKHRELKQNDLARQEIAQGKKILEEALRDYPDTDERAHANYLLANLAMEYAEELQSPEDKKQRYLEAISRFSELVSSYADSPYAPKSQFKKALAFEKLGQLDQACEEYVKLSYRYPDNELVAETIARLGQYFMSKGKEWQDKATAETDFVKKEKARLQMVDMFKSAAQVFGRLSVRFPDHQLANKTLVLSATCWIRAADLDKAVAVFGEIIDNKKADSDLVAQSMYWSGDCLMKKNDLKNAYRMFKRLTWDYPESSWAKYARGRLSEKALADMEEQDVRK